MKRQTIDFGIDLGTTNSAIAVLNGVTPVIVKNNEDADTTPSAVFIDKKGVVQVGLRARNRHIDNQEDAFIEFKRNMGTDYMYRFKSSGQSRSPHELSAEVLKSLCADVQQKTGEVVEASVITVPAAFELHQCDATLRAAQAAGLKESPLLQEPVAAALAHGFQSDRDKAYWLVYDLGGGTFDSAILKAEEGTITVVNHAGDNFLGGSDIDWAIVEQVLAPRLLAEQTLEDFRRSNPRWRGVFALLKSKAELAKIQLSRLERVTLEPVRIRDGNSDDYEFECEISRSDIIKVAEPIIAKSIETCHRVLKEKGLSPSAIEKLILVGGPTKAPYLREMLSDTLHIPIDFSVDPLTVVAQGAAVFASTQPRQVRSIVPVSQDHFNLELKGYKPVGADDSPLIGGAFSSPSTETFSGYTVEFTNTKSQWRSGKIALRANGVFTASLHAEKGERNVFSIELADPTGRLHKVTPETITYTVGLAIEEQTLTNSLGVAMSDNSYDILFKKGRGLPAKESRTYRTVILLKQGQTGQLVKIPLVEGEQEKADRNRLVSTLDVRGEDIRRDLPSGSEVEVTIKVDHSRIVTVTAYVPVLDEEYSVKVDMRKSAADPMRLQAEHTEELKRLKEAAAKARSAGDESAEQAVEDLEKSALIQSITESLQGAVTDQNTAEKCDKQILELKIKLDHVVDNLERPSLVAEIRSTIEDLHEIAHGSANTQQKSKADNLVSEAEELISQNASASDLRRSKTKLRSLFLEILSSQPSFWVHLFQNLEKSKSEMSETDRAERLIQQGRECMAKNNVSALENVARELLRLLPSRATKAVQRGYQSSLSK